MRGSKGVREGGREGEREGVRQREKERNRKRERFTRVCVTRESKKKGRGAGGVRQTEAGDRRTVGFFLTLFMHMHTGFLSETTQAEALWLSRTSFPILLDPPLISPNRMHYILLTDCGMLSTQ